jgi:ubiquinone/menaquinone biosynthesis C-methylase UbiE
MIRHMTQDRVGQVAALFDAVAPAYDQLGIPFFSPIAEHLVGLLAPRPGESVVELGCGRGALTVPLARAVGPKGSVRACDVSPAMVALAREAIADLPRADVTLMDATEPTYEPGSADVVAASLVLFFLPDPLDALRRWVRLLAPGGRIGLTTFGTQDEIWSSLDELFDPWLPPTVLDARTSGKRGPFATDESFARLMVDAGLTDVHQDTQSVTVRFEDGRAWQRWTMSVGQRMMWRFVPEDQRAGLVERADELLAERQDVRQDVRHSVARVPVS